MTQQATAPLRGQALKWGLQQEAEAPPKGFPGLQELSGKALDVGAPNCITDTGVTVGGQWLTLSTG